MIMGLRVLFLDIRYVRHAIYGLNKDQSSHAPAHRKRFAAGLTFYPKEKGITDPLFFTVLIGNDQKFDAPSFALLYRLVTSSQLITLKNAVI